MRNGFFMGYDASKLAEVEILEQARLLLDTGLYQAGYNVIRLGDCRDGRVRDAQTLALTLRARGFALDVTLRPSDDADSADALISEIGARMVTLPQGMEWEYAKAIAKALSGKVRIAICLAPEDFGRAAEMADVVELHNLRDTDDFFEITRNRLDSCRDSDTDPAASDANLRREALRPGGSWMCGNLPLRFDAYRNEAIFAQHCMLGCPLVLEGDIGQMSAATLALARSERLIALAMRGTGRVARYYDPWHVLLVKTLSDTAACAMILNRCHGDQPTNILPADMGWNGRFSVRELLSDRLIGANLEGFEVHVETSDHPQTPCCQLYILEKI